MCALRDLMLREKQLANLCIAAGFLFTFFGNTLIHLSHLRASNGGYFPNIAVQLCGGNKGFSTIDDPGTSLFSHGQYS